MLCKHKEKVNLDCLKKIPDSSTNRDVVNPASTEKAAKKCSAKSRQPNCALCQNHGSVVRTKGHKRFCPWRECSCSKCNFTKYRRHVVASQIAVRRAMIEDQEREREMTEVKVENHVSSNKQELPKQSVSFKHIPNRGNKDLRNEANDKLCPSTSTKSSNILDGNISEFQKQICSTSTPRMTSSTSFFDPRDYIKNLELASLVGNTQPSEAIYHMQESVQILNKMFRLPYGTEYPMHRIHQDFDGNFKLAAAKIFEVWNQTPQTTTRKLELEFTKPTICIP
ncbi:unnamed protein product [Orchesella dallaii]|uniref:DM domain-containing protein n=1 Tax=Orchesella dallaii TaxID=48710 RepID=A0ABP1S7L1_9HEXA